MKLVEILARELKAWPKNGCVSVTQEKNGYVYFWREKRLEFNGGRWSHHSGDGLCDKDYSLGKLPNIASDHATAIVTRADWQAAKDKLKGKTVKKPNANKDGWIRHRGGKCPVEGNVLVDYRMRTGMYSSVSAHAAELRWKHVGIPGDIMAYRIHTPSEQPAIAEKSSPVEPVAPIAGPLQWRDRITEIDAEQKRDEASFKNATELRSTERAELVQKLASEGLALIERKAEPVEDMSDPAKWRKGDLLECVHCPSPRYTAGKLYSFLHLSVEYGSARTIDNDGVENGLMPSQFKWHSRPTN